MNKELKVLFFGDINGEASCEYLRQCLPKIKRDLQADIVIANGENSAEGNGITPYSADYLLSSGVDVITTGNHWFRRKEMLDYYNSNKPIIRPYNLGNGVIGSGYTYIDLGYTSLAVVNLMGRAYMNTIDNPFKEVDELLKEISTKNIIVDFHAEATSEKKAMGFHLVGRVSAVLGTHTHVQTADETIINGHTGYITDVGMCGSANSVLGVKPEIILDSFINYNTVKHEFAKDELKLNYVMLTIDYKSGKCLSINRF